MVTMHGKPVLALALLSELIAARFIGHAFSRRGVDCTFTVAASSGDACETFADSWSITTKELRFINPDLDCAKFDGVAEYCVSGEVNDDKPTKTTATSNAADTTTAVTTSSSTETINTPTTTSSASDHEPTQPGLAENCDNFHKSVLTSGETTTSASTFLEQPPLLLLPRPLTVARPPRSPALLRTAISFTRLVPVTSATPSRPSTRSPKQFINWNPAIDSDCTNLQLDYNVCVHIPGATNTHGPTPQMPNLSSDCKKYHKIADGESCPAIQKEAGGITLAQFRKWNPTIDAKCSNLWSGYYKEVGINMIPGAITRARWSIVCLP
ncbi:hypothetical protein PENSOL_c002G05802 [Penicillium solitum]|uniref:LysM domain-containing protein n=1 Tax=Penicillium solitum TaxID=60172 RepID=A0A1V6RLG1_9EURO|nr:uncharacterized protein PENSOL_c002G05802 [Penicillium solitum]OQE02368.1 hypothetical protein PENSOL_c002G05802 [Penicillium solitum]